jgi:hypothetical protein
VGRILLLLSGISGVLVVLLTGWYVWHDIQWLLSTREAPLEAYEIRGLGLTREQWERSQGTAGRDGDGFVDYGGLMFRTNNLRVTYVAGRIWSFAYQPRSNDEVDLEEARERAMRIVPRDAVRISEDTSSDIERDFWKAEPGAASERQYTEVYRSQTLSRLSKTGDSSSRWSVGEAGIFTITYRMAPVSEVTSPPAKWKISSTLIEVGSRQ